MNVYEENYKFISHSLTPCRPADPETFRILIGNEQCTQPYSASILNISAMSFGSLSANAVRALNLGAQKANSFMIPGKVVSALIIWNMAVTLSGKLVADILVVGP